MNRTANSQQPRIPRAATDMSDPEIDLKRGEQANRQAEQSNPKFRLFMDKLRRAAKAVGRDMRIFLILALTLGIHKS
jgi:hypothetical protein